VLCLCVCARVCACVCARVNACTHARMRAAGTGSARVASQTLRHTNTLMQRNRGRREAGGHLGVCRGESKTGKRGHQEEAEAV